LAAEPKSASRARAFVCHHLVEYRLLHLVDNVRLVASELATNAIVHARTPSTLTLSRSGSTVLLELSDSSTDLPMRPPASQEQTVRTGGYGLGIFEALSLEWGVIIALTGTKTVWASFDAHPPDRPVTHTGGPWKGSPQVS
jgi:hypothetical protein